MIHQAPVTAIKMVRRIVRHQCYDYIYQHKLDQKQSFEFFHVNDDDLFIDLKLNYKNEAEREIQMMFNKPMEVGKKGKEFETMPFFLSDEFKTILEDKVMKVGGGMSDRDALNGTGGLG